MQEFFSIFCARRLTLQLGLFQTKNKAKVPQWGTLNAQDTARHVLGLSRFNYPCRIFTFDLPDSEKDQILKSYVKIGQNGVIEIFINNTNNHCWKRFYLFKELIHVIASRKNNVTTGFNQITEVIEFFQKGNLMKSLSSPANFIEMEAYLGALELLLPKEIVELEISKNPIGDFTDAQLTDIAVRYRVPKLLVSMRFTDADLIQIFNDHYNHTKYKNADCLTMYDR